MNKALENKYKKHAMVGDQLLDDFVPYLMNRIMGRYNESLRQKMMSLDLTTPKMRALAVLSALDGIFINELAVALEYKKTRLMGILKYIVFDMDDQYFV